MTDTSTARAARLALVADDEADRIRREEHAAAAKRRFGTWRWRFVGDEVHLRSSATPTLRIDVLRSEANDLMNALARALNEPRPATPRMTKAERARDRKARRGWNKQNAFERAQALKQLAKDFSEGGGW